MPTLAPNTRTRASLSELGALSLEGAPGSATVTLLSDGTSEEWEQGTAPALKACPELLTVEWELSGVTVSAEVDVVATRYCTLDEVRAYRASEYGLADKTDEEVWVARQHAEEVIERAAHRFFQPVMRKGFVDRPNCTTASMPLIPDVCPRDISSVARAWDASGNPVSVGVSGQTALDVSAIRPHAAANVALVMGMAQTPVEMHDAVVALAAWYLVPKAGPDNATSESTDSGVLRFVIGGVDGAPTSLPEVNALVQRYGFRDLLVG